MERKGRNGASKSSRLFRTATRSTNVREGVEKTKAAALPTGERSGKKDALWTVEKKPRRRCRWMRGIKSMLIPTFF